MKRDEAQIPQRALEEAASDMRAYLRLGYSFSAFKDRNTNGRKYGNALLPLWKKLAAERKDEKA